MPIAQSLALKLGETIKEKTISTVKDIGTGAKNAFIAGNPALFGPAIAKAEKLLSKKSDKSEKEKERKEQERDRRNQGFFEENSMEIQKYNKQVLDNIAGVNKNTESMDRTLKEILDVLKRCCACECNDSMLDKLGNLLKGIGAGIIGAIGGLMYGAAQAGGLSKPGPGSQYGRSSSSYDRTTNLPSTPVATGTTSGSGVSTRTVFDIPKLEPIKIQIEIPNVESIRIPLEVSLGSTLGEQISRFNYGLDSTGLKLGEFSDTVGRSSFSLGESINQTNSRLGALSDTTGRISTSITDLSIESGYKLGNLSTVANESAIKVGSVSGAFESIARPLSSAAELTLRLPTTIESLTLEFSKINYSLSESTIKIGQSVDIFSEQLRTIAQAAANKVPVTISGAAGAEVPPSSIYSFGPSSSGPSRIPATGEGGFRLGSSGAGGGGGSTPYLGYEPYRPGTSLALTDDVGRFTSRPQAYRPGSMPGPGVSDVWLSPLDRVKFGYGVGVDYLKSGYGAYTAGAGRLESAFLGNRLVQGAGAVGLGISGIEGALNEERIATSLGISTAQVDWRDRMYGAIGTMIGYGSALPFELGGLALRGGMNVGGYLTGQGALGEQYAPKFGDFSEMASRGWINILGLGRDRPAYVSPLDRPAGPGYVSSNVPERIKGPLKSGSFPTLMSDPNFADQVQKTANNLGVDPIDLLAIMAFESNLNPSEVNKRSGATGLIQFMPDTAKGLGTNTFALSQMKASEQLKYVENYYKNVGLKQGATLEDMYLATFLPAAANMPDISVLGRADDTTKIGKVSRGAIYSQNKEAFDPTGKGYFTKADVTRSIREKGYSRLSQVLPHTGLSESTFRPTFTEDYGQYSLFDRGAKIKLGGPSGTSTIPEDIENTSDGVSELLDVSKESNKTTTETLDVSKSTGEETRKLVTSSYDQLRQQELTRLQAQNDARRQFEMYSKTEYEKARRLEGYEKERKALQEKFDSQLQGIFRPMVNALMGPGATAETARAGSNLAKSLQQDFTKLGTTLFGKVYGPGIGQTFQELAGVYMNQFINESLAPALGMKPELLNRAINTYTKGNELFNTQLKQVGDALDKSRAQLKELETGKGKITEADIVTAAAKGGFTSEQKQRIAQLEAARKTVADQEKIQRDLKEKRGAYRQAALGDLFYGMTGVAITPANLIDQYEGGSEGLTKDLASVFGAPFAGLFGTGKEEYILSAEDAKKSRELQAKIAADQQNIQAQKTLYTDTILPGMQQAVQSGIQAGIQSSGLGQGGGGGTVIPGSAEAQAQALGLDIGTPGTATGMNIGSIVSGKARPGASNRVTDFGINLLTQAVGGRISKAVGGGFTGNMIGGGISKGISSVLRGGDFVQGIGKQFGLNMPAGSSFSDLLSAANASMMSPFVNLGATISNIGAKLGSQTLTELGAGMVQNAAGASLGSGATGAMNAGQYLGAAGNVLQSYMIGSTVNKALSGGYQVSKGFTTFQNIGTAVAGHFFGPIGSAIAGAVAGVVNRAFGRKAPVVKSSGMRGTIGGDAASLESYQNMFAKGGWFRSDKSWTETAAADPETIKAFNSATKGIAESNRKLLESMKLSTSFMSGWFGRTKSELENYREYIDVKFDPKDTEEQRMEKIQAAFKTFSDNMIKKVIPFMDQFTKDGESASDALERLGKAFNTAEPVIRSIGFIDPRTFFGLEGVSGVSQDYVKLTMAREMEQLIGGFGSEDEFRQIMSTFGNLAFSPEQLQQFQLQNMYADLADAQTQIADLGLSIDTSLIGKSVEERQAEAQRLFNELRDKENKGLITAKQQADGIKAIVKFLETGQLQEQITEATKKEEDANKPIIYGGTLNLPANLGESLFDPLTDTVVKPLVNTLNNSANTSAAQVASSNAAMTTITTGTNSAETLAYVAGTTIAGYAAATGMSTAQIDSAVQSSANTIAESVSNMTTDIGAGIDGVISATQGLTAQQASTAVTMGLALANFGTQVSSTVGQVSAVAALVGSAATALGNAAVNSSNQALATIDAAMIGGSVAAAQAAASHAADMSGGSADLAGGGAGADISGSGLGWARGGNVIANKPAIVGEVGPEIFIPNYAGNIVPTHRILEAMDSSRSLDSTTRTALNNISENLAYKPVELYNIAPIQNPITAAYMQQQEMNRMLEEQRDITTSVNNSMVSQNVTNVSSPQTNIVNQIPGGVRSENPIAGRFARSLSRPRGF
jgi:hypothetical protein